MSAAEVIEFRPQEGPQTTFLSSDADIVFYGGAAGGGKTFGLLLDVGRHQDNADFKALIFRRQSVQITNPGGLWDEATKMYSHFTQDFSGRPNFEVNFPQGASVKFAHLNQEDDKFNYQGAQVCYLGFDEVTHFSKTQFFYMLSRLRSVSGVPGHVRCTCNPDPDSWVAEFISWWIGEDGFPIPSRAGKKRWFIKQGDEIKWANTREELAKLSTKDVPVLPLSVTFIPAKITDNQILLTKDPQYLANLHAQDSVERARLLDGNWKIRSVAGEMFKRSWFKIIDALPPDHTIVARIRYWDRAATEPNKDNPNPDWTAGLLLLRDGNGVYYVAHVERFRATPLKVKQRIRNQAEQDRVRTKIGVEEDPGQAGVSEADDLVRHLTGYIAKKYRPTGDKITRAKPVSAQSEIGNIYLLRGAWNEAFLSELESFGENTIKDKNVKKDQVDAFSGAFNALNDKNSHTLAATSQL